MEKIADDVQQYITKLNSTIKNKSLLKKLGIGGATVGLVGEGYNTIKNIFEGGQ